MRSTDATKKATGPAAPREGAELIWNHYRCERCGQLTIAEHEDPGVTPFMVRCRATAGCAGSSFSLMYRGSQERGQRPHIIWFRPARDHVGAVIHAEVERLYHAGELPGLNASARLSIERQVRAHYDKGGCLMRVVERRTLV